VSPPCQAPVPFEALIAYHLRELSEAEAERVEDHYFSCPYCTERLEVMSLLEQGVRDLVRGGQLFASSTMAMVERVRAQGILVREYRTDPGEHVNCTAGPTDDLLVTRYGGLRGFTSVDVHFRGTIVGTDQIIEMEFPDSAVDQQTGDVVLIAPGALNRSMPPLDIEIRVIAHDASGPHEAGRYYYHHRPWDLLDDAERQLRSGR
jgi:Putative zinc-finger